MISTTQYHTAPNHADGSLTTQQSSSDSRKPGISYSDVPYKYEKLDLLFSFVLRMYESTQRFDLIYSAVSYSQG